MRRSMCRAFYWAKHWRCLHTANIIKVGPLEAQELIQRALTASPYTKQYNVCHFLLRGAPVSADGLAIVD